MDVTVVEPETELLAGLTHLETSMNGNLSSPRHTTLDFRPEQGPRGPVTALELDTRRQAGPNFYLPFLEISPKDQPQHVHHQFSVILSN